MVEIQVKISDIFNCTSCTSLSGLHLKAERRGQYTMCTVRSFGSEILFTVRKAGKSRQCTVQLHSVRSFGQ